VRVVKAFLLLFLATSVYAQDWLIYPHTPEGSLISFPADEGRHPSETVEWWYVAGHLTGESTGNPYSFMLSYFYYPGDTLGISYDGFRILNLTNESSGEFHTETMPVRSYRDLATDHLHLDVQLFNSVYESWDHREEPVGTRVPYEYVISATADNGALNLSTALQKRPLIPGGDGLFDQGANSYTYYYSLTDNLVTGTINFDGLVENVNGSAWIDRQYGSFNPYSGEQYEWFFIQLSNGMDLNVWNLFTPANLLPEEEAYKHMAVYVDEDTQYTEHDFSLERVAFSCVPASGNCYARQWRLTSVLNQLDLLISTHHKDSEVSLPFTFFEGSTTVSGTVNGSAVTGKGFAELLKQYEAPQLSLVTPKDEWDKAQAISWTVEDPDQGRTLLFDLEYSTNQGTNWLPVVVAISDTFYHWTNPPLADGDSCLFRVKGYTADHTLEGSFENPMHTLYRDVSSFVDLDRNPSFLIYPNPVGSFLAVRWKDADMNRQDFSYQISDFLGKEQGSGSLSDEKIDVSRLPGGMYLIILQGPGGRFTQTFIKE
jgi:predicted secreted hydrolase